ncbi:MAG: hypothetical protein CBE47_02925 [Pelagibacteraceae bacterium TMED287]|nr:MAG: hypothetical protein CBE47_02925 [Pelagibacteraceae bacterium TMED287]
MFERLYQNIVLEKPKSILLILILCVLSFGYFSKDFKLDASADTLLLENDPDFLYLKEITEKFGTNDFLILTYEPIKKIIHDQSINELLNLKSDIEKFDWVKSVVTILDVPILENSDDNITETLKNYKTLKDKNIDRDKAFEEILKSPVFKNFIISDDGSVSSIIVNIKKDNEFENFNEEKIQEIRENQKVKNHENILEIRTLINKYKTSDTKPKIYLGGVPMIADDMISFIKKDIIVFGVGVFLFIILTLWFVFRSAIWIIIPLMSCFCAVTIMIGLLGVIGWKVTVISSNFIALMLILTMAMNIHLSVRYLNISQDNQHMSNLEIILLTTKKMFWPIIYTVLTTACAFLSLIFSGIKPIIDFGWMMTFGLLISFLITFTLLPIFLSIFSKKNFFINKEPGASFTNFLSDITLRKSNLIFVVTSIIIIISIIGILKLEVENSFINYFSKKTEIYKGMKLIDQKLGGTTPLEIILKFPENKVENEELDNEFENDDEFESWDDEENISDNNYWFTEDKINRIHNTHSYLENLEHVGKVLSFSSILQVAEKINNNKKLGTLEMGILYSKLPDNIKKQIVDPYISIKNNEARISIRIKDSNDNLRRNDLINKIQYDLENKLKFKKEEFKIAGVLVLFNNLLQSLFKSQILTLGFVMMGILFMFLILFRNLTISLIGVMPNFIAAFFILGIIGIASIPLDMMTITIAAITIGIAVDNSIHYIYRFREEYMSNKNYDQTLKKCHSTVGVAILNTSITIIFGFSILVFSNFIPTIYFGIFTGLAMFIAMISVLTLLPKLILVFKPFGN